MITASTPSDLTEIKSLVRDAEFQVSGLAASPGIVVSPLHVKTSDGDILMTWDSQYGMEQSRIPASDEVLKGLVRTAQKALSRFPHSARCHTNLGCALLKADDTEGAIHHLRSALSIDANDEVAAITLAGALSKTGRFQDSEELLVNFAQGRVCTESIYLALANTAVRQKAYDRARSYILSATAKNGESGRAQFLLGIIELNSGHLTKAVGALRRATHLEVRNPLYHQMLGIAYAVAKDLTHAEIALSAAVKLLPRSGESIRALAQVLLDKGQASKAIDVLDGQVAGEDVAGRQLLARAYAESGRYEMARSISKGTLQMHGDAVSVEDRVSFLNIMAVAFLRDDKSGEAEIALRQAIKLGPTVSSVPYENLGRVCLYYLEKPQSAIDVLMMARKIFPDSQKTTVLLSIALASRSRQDTAIAVHELLPFWEKGVAEESTVVCLGWLYQRSGDPSMAIRVLSDGLSRFKGSLSIINNLAYTYLMEGNTVSAKKILETIPVSASPHPELIATFGLFNLWRGDVDTGQSLYEKAEALAAAEGSKDKAKRVRQKKHLEMARMFLRLGSTDEAEREVKKGLDIRGFPLSYRDDLEELASSMKG